MSNLKTTTNTRDWLCGNIQYWNEKLSEYLYYKNCNREEVEVLDTDEEIDWNIRKCEMSIEYCMDRLALCK